MINKGYAIPLDYNLTTYCDVISIKGMLAAEEREYRMDDEITDRLRCYHELLNLLNKASVEVEIQEGMHPNHLRYVLYVTPVKIPHSFNLGSVLVAGNFLTHSLTAPPQAGEQFWVEPIQGLFRL